MQTNIDARLSMHDERIDAALFWDVRALLGGSDDAARIFYAAMTFGGGGGIGRVPTDLKDSDPLAVAGTGLYRELSGDRGGAFEAYSTLTASKSGKARLLGMFLNLWSPQGEQQSIDEIHDLIDVFYADNYNLLLRFKVLSILWNSRRFDRAADVANQLYKRSSGTWLFRFVQSFVLNEHLGESNVGEWPGLYDFRSETGQDRPVEVDLLITQPWLANDLAELWQKDAESAFQRRTDSPFQNRSFFGRDRTGAMLAVEQQTVWAGQFWALATVDRTIGLAMITPASASGDELWTGIQCYAAGRGQDMDRAVDVAEVRGRPTTDSGWASLLDTVPSWNFRRRYKLLGALWDLLDDDTAETELRKLPPSSNRESFGSDELDSAIYALGRRNPIGLVEYLERLDGETRSALFNRSIPSYASELKDTAFPKLIVQAVNDTVQAGSNPTFLLQQAAVSFEHGFQSMASAGVVIDPNLVVVLARAPASNKHGDDFKPWLAQSRHALEERADAALREGQNGTSRGFEVDPFTAFASAGQLTGFEEAKDAFSRLVYWASKSSSLTIFDILRACVTLADRYAKHLPKTDVRRLLSMQLPSDDLNRSLFGATRPGELGLLQACIGVLSGPRRAGFFELVLAAARSPDACLRIRAFGCFAASMKSEGVLSRSQSVIAANALYNGLFDPDDVIVRYCVAQMSTALVSAPGLTAATRIRVRELVSTRSRAIRLAAIELAVALGTNAQLLDTSALSALYENDHSWLIRNSVLETINRSAVQGEV